MSGADREPFGGYGIAIRTFWIDGTNFLSARRWSKESTYNSTESNFSTYLSGKAITTDSVSVIGGSERVREFGLSIESDEDAKQSWQWHKANDVGSYDGNAPELRAKRRINEVLEEAPPTATLFLVEADRETGIQRQWNIECKIPRPVLQHFERELLAEQTKRIQIGIRWVFGLILDEHAPLSVPTTWGLFRISDQVEPLYGHVTSLNWHLGS